MCKLRGSSGNAQGVSAATTSRDDDDEIQRPQTSTSYAAAAAANTSSPTHDNMPTTTCFRTSCLWVNCSRFRTYFSPAATHDVINLDDDEQRSLTFAQDTKRFSLHEQWLIKTCGVPRRRYVTRQYFSESDANGT